ncbi:hypothetical protein [Mammaliicoccus sciuri]|uniref:hypothetical protein n=1 Tax=Mammaliicoccus sciuri TaxID=1296 RepID=UPI003A93031B
MKNIPKSTLIIGITAIVVIGILVFIVRYYDDELNKANNQNKENDAKIGKLEDTNKAQSDLIKRQDKDVVSKEEEKIRDNAKTFINKLFTMNPNENFNDRKKELSPILEDKYTKELFSNSSNKYNAFLTVKVSNIKTFIEEYRPQKDSYDVFVTFDEKVIDDEDTTDKKTSGKIHFVRKNGKWLIDDFERFTLESNTKDVK